MTAGQRVTLARHVWATLARLKRTYLGSLEAAFAPDPVPAYFLTTGGQVKLLGYLMGVEAWHHVIFGRPEGPPQGRWLLSCAATAYDDAVDCEGARGWDELDRFLGSPYGSGAFGSGPAGTAVFPTLARMALRPDVPWREMRRCCTAINGATRAGFEAARSAVADPALLRQTTRDKGGCSFQALTAIAGARAVACPQEVVHAFGAACQLADDIFDTAEDDRLGHRTLASARLLSADDRRLLATAADGLPRHAAALPASLVGAWRAHLRSALRLYDSGRAPGLRSYDFGQSLFRIGVKVLPPRL